MTHVHKVLASTYHNSWLAAWAYRHSRYVGVSRVGSLRVALHMLKAGFQMVWE